MTKDELKETLKEVLQEELGPFFVEREQHYQDHNFVKSVREGFGTARKASIWTISVAFVSAILYAIFGWK